MRTRPTLGESPTPVNCVVIAETSAPLRKLRTSGHVRCCTPPSQTRAYRMPQGIPAHGARVILGACAASA